MFLVVWRDTLTYVRTKRVLTIDESGNHIRHQAKLQRALDSEVRLDLNCDLLWAACKMTEASGCHTCV